MPSTVDGAIAYLIAQSIAFKQHYAPGVFDELKRWGKTTRIMPTKRRKIEGSNIEYTIKRYHNHGTKASKDLMSESPDPDLGAYATFQVRFNHTDPSVNDIMKLELGFQTTWFDIKKQADSTWKDSPNFIQKDIEEGMEDVKQTLAKYLHLPTDGLLATVATSGVRDADSDIWSGTTTYSNGNTKAMFKLQPCSLGLLDIGSLIEIRTSGGVLVANNVRVTNANPFDNTITVAITDDTVDANDNTLANADTFDDNANNKLYISGCYNVAASGTLEGFFDPTVLYYQRDRLDPTYNLLMPKRLDANAGAATGIAITEDLFRKIGETVAWTEADSDTVQRKTMVMSRNEYRGVTKIIKDSGITITPALNSQVGQEFVKALGFKGQVLYDPNLGAVMMIVDDFAKYGKIDFLNMDQWELALPIDGGFDMLPGTYGFWSRLAENSGSGKMSKRFGADGLQLFAAVCTVPWKQVRLQGLLTTM